MLHIVFLDADTLGSTSLDGLRPFGNLTLHPVTAPHETAGRVRDAD